MTCKDFSSHISTDLREGQLGSEAAMHLENCTTCRRSWYAGQELSRRLGEARQSAPTVPLRLDLAVMAAFRDRRQSHVNNRKQVTLFRTLAWSGIAATVILGILVFTRAHIAPTPVAVSWKPPVAVAPPPITQARTTQATVKVAKAHRVVAAKGKRPVPSATTLASAESTNGFENLMYCDELSCSGPMDVIRIQVPAQSVDVGSGQQSRQGFVQADVVVGSDGVARAIRIVK